MRFKKPWEHTWSGWQPFQFSLWDSALWVGWHVWALLASTFNSLYEIRPDVERGRFKTEVLSILSMRFTGPPFISTTMTFDRSLSILSMRFCPSSSNTLLMFSILYFQFSLWDSDIFLAGGGLLSPQVLSILSMRFTCCVRRIQISSNSFNSLYEIHDAEHRLRAWGHHNIFQFSLWDSQVLGWSWLATFSALFQFSLWDSTCLHMLYKLHQSIHFQFSLWDSRRWNHQHHRYRRRQLSILSMRFSCLKAWQLRATRCSFQFSLWDSWSERLSSKPGGNRESFNSLYEIPASACHGDTALHLA